MRFFTLSFSQLISHKSCKQTNSKEDTSVIQHPTMIIQLPLENWADLLHLVPRHQLVDIFKQLGDRQFASILKFFLTKEVKITLDHLRIVAPRENDPNGGPIVEVRKEIPSWFEWDMRRPPIDLETNLLEEEPLPNNVKDFKLIELSYFDASVADFLRQFQREQQPAKSLLNNVNLWFSPSIFLQYDHRTIMPILVQLMPMVGNINSVFICRLHHMELESDGLEPNNAASQLLTTMLTKARILEIHEDMQVSTFAWCSWLYESRKDGKPRALRLYGSYLNAKNLIEQIKKDFSKATSPVSFFVYVQAFKDILFGSQNDRWQDTSLDNGQTNERLTVKTIDPPPGDPFHIQFDPEKHVLISRYPVEATKEWMGANEQEIIGWKFHEHNRLIRF